MNFKRIIKKYSSSNFLNLVLIFRIFTNISKKLRYQSILVFLLLLLTSFAEMNFLIIFADFIGLLTKEPVTTNSNILLNLFGDKCFSRIDCVGIVLGVSVLISSFLRIFLIWCNAIVAANLEKELATSYFRKTVTNNYSYFIENSSDKIISDLLNHVPASGGAIRSFFMFLTSLILSIGIISALYRVNSSLTLITGLLFFLIYLAIAVSTKKFVIDTGYVFEQTSKKRIEVIQQAIGGIRDIIIDRSQNFLLKEYSLNVIKQLRTQAILQFLSLSPRYFLEGLGIFFIAIITIILTSLESNALKSIAVIAIGAQRLLPSINQLFNGWMGILARRASLEIVSSEIDKKNVQTKNLNFQKSLKFENSILLNKVFYGYPNSEKFILKDINLLIQRGEKIGIIGKTGSGKTTLTDLLLGLLYPTKGEIKIDGIKLDDSNASNWHSQISHVPQSLFISNSSIADNIAFCTNLNSSILKRVKEVAEIVGIDEFIESLPEKYNTGVGERGIRLSGGQIQRLAIARALFKKPKVLILDEATSALDNKTQNNVMNSLQDFLKETTLIQITHRTSNLDFCDRVLLVENCQVIET